MYQQRCPVGSAAFLLPEMNAESYLKIKENVLYSLCDVIVLFPRNKQKIKLNMEVLL